ncbi:YraN family protein [Patescibacteria group bacterium]|nr:YraN family protein [Patescibacteria group bacterium]MBU4512778.1 YraN family protein [Patescibacteria group bacterium]MCG2692533.1 YraN family protein [Candidatus Parcubacteria bacterium]
MITKKRKLGDFGERLARRYLERNGHTVIDTNFQTRAGEIDIIARDAFSQLVFVEVKTRTSIAFGQPEESVTNLKQNKLLKTINDYLYRQNIQDDNWRLDIISVQPNFKTHRAKISHFKAIRFW